MDAFVAAPKTYVVERGMLNDQPHTSYLPVVGWVYVQGTVAYPICPLAFGGLTDKRAVLMPSGEVCDRAFDAVFENLTEWEAACDLKGPINRDADAPKGPLVQSMTEVDPGDETPATTKPAPAAKPGKPKKIKTLQQKSFWGFKEGQIIMVVEGGTPLPDEARWQKITRDEFGIRKKDGYSVVETEDAVYRAPDATAETDSDIDDLV